MCFVLLLSVCLVLLSEVRAVQYSTNFDGMKSAEYVNRCVCVSLSLLIFQSLSLSLSFFSFSFLCILHLCSFVPVSLTRTYSHSS